MNDLKMLLEIASKQPHGCHINSGQSAALLEYINKLEQERDQLMVQSFIDAYKYGFDHGLKCDKSEIENTRRTATSIRLFDYQLECHIRAAAERYIRQKTQE